MRKAGVGFPLYHSIRDGWISHWIYIPFCLFLIISEECRCGLFFWCRGVVLLVSGYRSSTVGVRRADVTDIFSLHCDNTTFFKMLIKLRYLLVAVFIKPDGL